MEKVTKTASEIVELVESSGLSVTEKVTAVNIAQELLALHRAEEIRSLYPDTASALSAASSFLDSRSKR